MKRTCVLITANSAGSGRMLADAIGASARYGPDIRCRALIRYGSARNIGCSPSAELNNRQAVLRCTDKLRSLELMAAAGVPVPEVMCGADVRVPALGRERHHARGSGIILCRTQEDVDRATERGSEYFVSCVAKHREYRIHVFRGSVIKSNVKLPNPEWNGGHSDLIRSLHYGWRFRAVNPALDPNWDEVLSVSTRAVTALGLDFGAVDIARDREGRLWVFEVNSAPALASPLTLDAYRNAILHWLEEKEVTRICAPYSA